MSRKNLSKPKTSDDASPIPNKSGGVNLKKRLMTAGILIPIVCVAASYPQTWFVLNVGKNLRHNLCQDFLFLSSWSTAI